MKLTPVYLDYESFWSQTHSLSKMTNIEYVHHPDTELISMAMKIGDGETETVFGESDIRHLMGEVNWSNAMCIGHNMSEFDSLIVRRRLNVKPALWGCTLAMARPKYAKTVGLSLKALCAHFGIGTKDNAALVNTRGKHLCDFTPAEIEAMRVYNRDDTEMCAALFKILVKGFLRQELWQIHATTQMLVEPRFVLDQTILKAALEEEKTNKQQAMLKLAEHMGVLPEWTEQRLGGGIDLEAYVRPTLASAPKFAELLESRGVDVPMKPSPTNPEKRTYALAKTDQAFLDLQEHDDPIVSAAVRARLAIKSTLMETRSQALMDAADRCNGRLPIPLAYCGADTTGRWSGRIYNPQNFPRINSSKPKVTDAIRKSLVAPDGFKIVVSDLSGIELRVNHFLWQVESSMALYNDDPEADLYRAFAAARYRIGMEDVDNLQRQMAKVAQLGLGFGSGWSTFKRVAKAQHGLIIPEAEAQSVVTDWRSQYHAICTGWKKCHLSLSWISQGQERHIDPWGLCSTTSEGIRLPSGRMIYYPNLRREEYFGSIEWVYGNGRHRTKLIGPKVDENIVQALARDIIAGVAYNVWKRCKATPVLTVHDELAFIVKEDYAAALLNLLDEEMRAPTTWWPELVKWSEGGISDSYGEAK